MQKYNGAACPSYRLKLKYLLPFLVSYVRLVTQQFKSKHLCNKSSHYEKYGRFLIMHLPDYHRYELRWGKVWGFASLKITIPHLLRKHWWHNPLHSPTCLPVMKPRISVGLLHDRNVCFLGNDKSPPPRGNLAVHSPTFPHP